MTYRLAGTTHFLTIDVADWTSDPDVAAAVARRNYAPLQERPGALVDGLLGDLEAANTRATFFVTGPIAQRDAALVRRISQAGHEVAARGAPGLIDVDDFRADASNVKLRVENAIGAPVFGFRAPFTASTSSALGRFEVLIEEGFEYDSSRLPRTTRGRVEQPIPSYPQTIVCSAGMLIEVPLMRQPFASGPLSIRRAPYASVREILASRTNAGLPGVLAFATWEIDRDQPKVTLPVLTSWRHYRGRRAAHDRVDRLLQEFRFDAIGYRLSELAEQAPAVFTI